MKNLVGRLGVATLSIASAAAFAGCGSSVGPSLAPAVSAGRDGSSWISPAAKHRALLYVSDPLTATVYVYSYPDLAPQGSLTGFATPLGLCVDQSNGNIWVTDDNPAESQAVEFAHGGTTPIASVHESDGDVQSCSVNPVNHDLAVANSTQGGDDPGGVDVFPGGQGAPTFYQHGRVFYYDFLSYDDRGNLFVAGSGYGGHRTFWLLDLRAGATKLKPVPWHGRRMTEPGNVQFDDGNLAIGNQQPARIFRTERGKVIGKTLLSSNCWVQQFYIERHHVIAPTWCRGSSSEVEIYDYPAGGAPVASIGGFADAFGAVVSR